MNNFLRDYILHLKEDGELDWLLYNLGVSKGWRPLRLPFSREEEGKNTLKKGEREFGIDLAFLAGDQSEELIIIVLKAIKLNSVNWKKSSGFREDLEEAVEVQLQERQYRMVEKVKVITAYNKDEDKNGKESYERFVRANRTNTTRKIEHPISIVHKRWNIESLHNLVEEHLFNPDLLPRKVASGLHYLCTQFQDFKFGTSEWEKITKPTWTQLYSSILKEKKGKLESKIRLVTMACSIVGKYLNIGGEIRSGYLDLVENALLDVFQVCRGNEKDLKIAYSTIWKLYLESLENYIDQNGKVFLVEDGFSLNYFFGLTYVANAHRAFWNMGRLCILILVFIRYHDVEKKSSQKEVLAKKLEYLAGLFFQGLQNESSFLRPLVDLHHRELFLIWLVLFKCFGVGQVAVWLGNLFGAIAQRRSKSAIIQVPFIEAYSRWDLVAEYAASSNRPLSYRDDTSFLVTMLMEMAYVLPTEDAKNLVAFVFDKIVSPVSNSDEQSMESLKLLSWRPLKDWPATYVGQPHRRRGHIIPLIFEGNTPKEKANSFKEYIQSELELIEEIRVDGVSETIYFLASLKHDSPIPPFWWRNEIKSANSVKEENKKGK